MLIKIRILFTILYGFTVVKSFIKLILHSKQSLSTIQNRQYNAIKYHVYGKKFLLVPCFSLHAKPLDFSSTGRPNRRASQNEIVSEESTNSVEDETMVSEVELKAVWKRSGRPMLSFNVQQALILLMNEDDDEDKDSITALKKNGQVLSSLQLTNSTDKKTTSKIPSAPITGSNTELTDYIQKLKKNMSGGSIQITGGKSAGLSNRENKNSNQKSITSGVPAGRSVGIDLGTTFSAVSIVELGRPKIIPVDGARITPSVVGYLPTGEILVGEPARRQLVVNPQNSFASTKRVIGRSLEECETTGDNLVALRIDRTRSGEFCVLKCPILGRPLLPEEVSAEVLRKLLRAAQEYIGYDEPITKAVITVPAYFLPNQCTATEKAGKLAGLEKVKLLREPEAAALAYGLARKSPQIVLVFDLGK